MAAESISGIFLPNSKISSSYLPTIPPKVPNTVQAYPRYIKDAPYTALSGVIVDGRVPPKLVYLSGKSLGNKYLINMMSVVNHLVISNKYDVRGKSLGNRNLINMMSVVNHLVISNNYDVCGKSFSNRNIIDILSVVNHLVISNKYDVCSNHLAISNKYDVCGKSLGNRNLIDMMSVVNHLAM
ncbi:hypothetical protein LOTGIDRAFT_159741 [Lottia gigantea]|uniref:Uncharacterized protein n=1 Tax=Lottia gigantea TaxID=225164 RepID=V4ATE2_LOTGI|nr:hypothetical protein LOTGIDRAFT_159741 [Lottia gigantea]ESO96996.1 hypothetical protein LOTGIDRAFT_159741 [Lottia gigantea]